MYQVFVAERVRNHEAWQNYGNGNKKKKKDIWMELASFLRTHEELVGSGVYSWISDQDDADLANRLQSKWNSARSAFKDYQGHVNRSGKDRAVKPRLVALSSTFCDWCFSQPDLTLTTISVRRREVAGLYHVL